MTDWPDLKKAFPWNENSRAISELLADGFNDREAAEEIGISRGQVSCYKKHPEFLQQVVDLTLTHNQASLAGLLQSAMRAVKIKGLNIEEDKDTFLAYLKFINDISPGTELKEEKQKITIVVK